MARLVLNAYFFFYIEWIEDKNPIMKQLGNIIQGAVWGTIGLISAIVWIYLLCCRKKARMTQEELDQEQKNKWEQNNGHQRF